MVEIVKVGRGDSSAGEPLELGNPPELPGKPLGSGEEGYEEAGKPLDDAGKPVAPLGSGEEGNPRGEGDRDLENEGRYCAGEAVYVSGDGGYVCNRVGLPGPLACPCPLASNSERPCSSAKNLPGPSTCACANPDAPLAVLGGDTDPALSPYSARGVTGVRGGVSPYTPPPPSPPPYVCPVEIDIIPLPPPN